MPLTNSTLQKKSWYKRPLLLLGFLFACLLGLLLTLPSLLSSKTGTKWLCKEIFRQKGIELSIDSLSLQWFGPQMATGIQGAYVKKKLTFSGKQIETSASLFELIFQNQFQQMVIESPQVTLETPLIPPSVWIYRKPPTYKAGMIPEWQLATSSLHTTWKGSLQIKEGSFACKDPHLDPISFSNISCNLDLQEEIMGELTADTLAGKEKGNLSVRASFQPSSDFQMQLALHNLPTQGLDQCASLFFPEYQGLLPALAGSSIDVEAQVLSQGDLLNTHIDLASPLIEIHLDGKSSPNLFSLTKPAEVKSKLSPDLLKYLERFFPSLKRLTLTAPVPLQMTFSSLQFTLPFQGFNALNIALETSLQAPLVGTWDGIPFQFTLPSCKMDSPSLREQVSFSINTLLQMGSVQGSLNLIGQLNSPFSLGRTGSLECTANQFPLQFLSAWKLDPELLFGEFADVTFAWKMQEEKPEICFSWQSKKLQIPETTLAFTSLGWELTSPISFAYDLDPRILNQPILLSHITPIQGTVHKFSFLETAIDQLVLVADVGCKQAVFAGAFNQTLNDIEANLSIQGCQNLSLQTKSDSLSFTIAGGLNPYEKTFRFSKPISLQYILKNPSLVDPAPLQITIEPFALSLSNQSLSAMKGQLFVAKIGIKTEHTPLFLQDTASTFQWNDPSQRLDVQFSSQISGTIPGAMQGKLSFFPDQTGRKLDKKNLSCDGSLQLRSVSSELLSLLCQIPSLPSFVGDAIDADCEFASFPQESSLDLKWTSPLLNFHTAWVMNQKELTLTLPTTLNWICKPSQFQGSFLELEQDLPMTLSLSQCTLPLEKGSTSRFTNPSWKWNQSAATANLNFSHLQTQDPTSHDRIEIASFNADFYKAKEQPLLDFKTDALIESIQPSGKKEGSLVISLQVSPETEDSFSLATSRIKLHANAQQLPTFLFDLLAKTANKNSQYAQLLGKSLYGSIDLSLKNLTGPVSVEIHTPTTELFCQGELMQGALVLNQPLRAQFSLRESSSQALLGAFNPLDLSAVYSQNPITLTLMPERFYLPIHPWQPEKCTIPKGSLELGKIRCLNEGNVNIALNLLKSSGNGNQLNLWFAPLDFSIQEGIALVERTEILLSDSFDICLYGKLNLVRNDVDMTLGLTAQALNRAFGIKGLPKDYVLTIPMKGKLDNVEINSSKATAKVGLLLAWQHKMLQGAIGGAGGAIANELLGAIATLPDANASVPPPKRPFPWERQQEEERPVKKSKKRFKTSDKPLKQLFKVMK